MNARVVEKTLPIDSRGVVRIKAYKGTILLLAGDMPEVQVVARVEPDGESPREIEDVEFVKILIEPSSSGVSIEADYSEVEARRRVTLEEAEASVPFVRFAIGMPQGGSVEIKDYKSDIDVRGVHGDVRLDTYKGVGSLVGLGGGLDLKTYKGELRIEVDTLTKDLTFDTYKGHLEVIVPRTSSFVLGVERGKNATFDTDFQVAGLAESRKGAGRIVGSVGSGGPRIRFSSDKGELALKGS